MKLKPASCIYIGDTPEDLQMAPAAGMSAIAVLGPFPTAARPAHLLNSVKEVPALLRKLQKSAMLELNVAT
jgi:phosphoglycolate phosphatase-like HAD superfamily hydrolase